MFYYAKTLQKFARGVANNLNKMTNQKKSFEKLNNPVDFTLLSSQKTGSGNKKDIQFPLSWELI